MIKFCDSLLKQREINAVTIAERTLPNNKKVIDGSSMSVQASDFHYCEPRRSGLKTYTSYEIGCLSEILDELKEYAEAGTQDFLTASYPYVPVEVVSQIVKEHGGVDKESTLHPKRKLDGYKEEKDGMQKKAEKAAALINRIMAQIGNLLEGLIKEDDMTEKQVNKIEGLYREQISKLRDDYIRYRNKARTLRSKIISNS